MLGLRVTARTLQGVEPASEVSAPLCRPGAPGARPRLEAPWRPRGLHNPTARPAAPLSRPAGHLPARTALGTKYIYLHF